jgi:pyridoxal phosphate enzyme (YggS family)
MVCMGPKKFHFFMIRSNLAKVRSELHKLTSTIVELVAVSKTKPAEQVVEAYEADQRHFGENYVSELVDKYKRLPQDIKWHFIGHLQSNKIAKLLTSCPELYIIETVDSQKLAQKINRTISTVERRTKLKVLVEVLTSAEGTKSGVSQSEVLPLIRFIMDSCPNLEFDGLMTIADPSKPENSFRILQELKIRLESESIPVRTMSMGMSGDYPIALQYGSNQIRIGSSIFGSR